MKKIFILLTILLLAISCNNGSTNPGNVNTGGSTGNEKPEVEIDPNKANIRVTTQRYIDLPIRIIIIDSYNKEISIGQLTTADDVNPDVVGVHTYSKIFTFIPGTYTLILKAYGGYEKKYENLSFSAGSLEEYEF